MAKLRAVSGAVGRCLGEDGVRDLVRDAGAARDRSGSVGRWWHWAKQRAFVTQQERAREAKWEQFKLRQRPGVGV